MRSKANLKIAERNIRSVVQQTHSVRKASSCSRSPTSPQSASGVEGAERKASIALLPTDIIVDRREWKPAPPTCGGSGAKYVGEKSQLSKDIVAFDLTPGECARGGGENDRARPAFSVGDSVDEAESGENKGLDQAQIGLYENGKGERTFHHLAEIGKRTRFSALGVWTRWMNASCGPSSPVARGVCDVAFGDLVRNDITLDVRARIILRLAMVAL